MNEPFREALAVVKAVQRNGFDAYIINAQLQRAVLTPEEQVEIDLATDASFDELLRVLPEIERDGVDRCLGAMAADGVSLRFFPADFPAAAHPEECVARLTPRLFRHLEDAGEISLSTACSFVPGEGDPFDGFADIKEGHIRLVGLPELTLKQNFLRGIRAMRLAANEGLPIERNTWFAMLRFNRRITGYVPMADIMNEWRKVDPTAMSQFVNLLYESMILHAILPELAIMARVRVKKADGTDDDLLELALSTMREYARLLPLDWWGTFSILFHNVGKVAVAEVDDGDLVFHQHHLVGERITRKMMRSLGVAPEDTDLVCRLVANHERFHIMLNDRGIRRFAACDEYPRLIEMARAAILARGGSFAEFNHNLKMLERVKIPEGMLEPLLNGRQIMGHTGLKPGPNVGVIREALLAAQVAGDVSDEASAIAFVKDFAAREQLA